MLPRDSVGAEIGVWKGEFSRRLVEVARPRELHLIDPWAFQPEFPTRLYGGGEARSQADMDAIFEGVAADLGANPAVRIHRRYSRDAAAAFPDDYFDWIYVDGNHSYEAVREDLVLFFPKVKPGGLITGDDYRKGVKRAVDELAAAGRVRFVTARKRQFVLRKPEG